MKSVSRSCGSTWAQDPENDKDMREHFENSPIGYILPIWGEASFEAL